MDAGALLIDTPGMRELELWDPDGPSRPAAEAHLSGHRRRRQR